MRHRELSVGDKEYVLMWVSTSTALVESPVIIRERIGLHGIWVLARVSAELEN